MIATTGKSEKSPTKAGVGFLGLNLVAILFLTLRPLPTWQWQVEKRFDLCVLCTMDAVPDFLLNILLFLPLGVALAFRCYRLWSAVLFGGLFSLAIEITQFVIPGREPSLQDIGSNMLGTLLGFGMIHSYLGSLLVQVIDGFRQIWWRWKRPTPILAHYLAGGATFLAISVFSVTGWLLKPTLPPGPYFITAKDLDTGSTPLRIGANGDGNGYFKGVIDEVRIYNRALAPAEIEIDRDKAVGAATRSISGLVASYGFEEEHSNLVLDGSGQGNNGVLIGAERTIGKFGNALMFNGDHHYAIIPHAQTLDLRNSFTLEAWVRPETSSNSWPTIIEKQGDFYFLHAGADSILTPNGGGMFGGIREGVEAPEPLAFDHWSHLAATYDGSNLRMYVNGRLVANRLRWFQGRIDRMWVDDTEVHSGPVDTRWLTAALIKGSTIRLSGIASPFLDNRGILLDIRKVCNRCPDQDILLLAADGDDLILQSFTIAMTFGLSSPMSRFHGVLADIGLKSPLNIELAGMGGNRSLIVDGTIYHEPGYSIGMGWTTFIHSEYLAVWLHEWLNLIWIVAWVFPIGFWSRTYLGSLGFITIFGSGIWLLSAVGILMPTPVIQWIAAILGFFLGIGIRWAIHGGHRPCKKNHSILMS